MIAPENNWVGPDGGRMGFNHHRISVSDDPQFDEEILRQLRETLELIRNSGGRKNYADSGIRLGDYHHDVRLDETITSRISRK